MGEILSQEEIDALLRELGGAEEESGGKNRTDGMVEVNLEQLMKLLDEIPLSKRKLFKDAWDKRKIAKFRFLYKDLQGISTDDNVMTMLNVAGIKGLLSMYAMSGIKGDALLGAGEALSQAAQNALIFSCQKCNCITFYIGEPGLSETDKNDLSIFSVAISIQKKECCQFCRSDGGMGGAVSPFIIKPR